MISQDEQTQNDYIHTLSQSSREVKNLEYWASHIEDPWLPAILSLDYGGIRSCSTLLILESLMHEIWEAEQKHGGLAEGITEKDLLPCHYFDFMYGTSTGGLIAIFLSRLRRPISEALFFSRRVAHDTLTKKRSIIPLGTKYYPQPLERAFKNIIAQHCPNHPNCTGESDPFLWPTQGYPFNPTNPRVSQTACRVTKGKDFINTCIFRSFPCQIFPREKAADELPIWKVALATTATLFYLPAVSHNGSLYQDGAPSESNPSFSAYGDFHTLYGNTKPALLLSLGAGVPDAGLCIPPGLGFLLKEVRLRSRCRRMFSCGAIGWRNYLIRRGRIGGCVFVQMGRRGIRGSILWG
ncbi:FabD/lysophospholipase-like protein [Piedraia hortae CBS 480.64]|uniref:FabD/lysophospholipase-like protein n=1 Tax=Piedraia hortae CBS 480.64 TaxID=1314780 RepID=A0A6A7C0B0_9PEZI|nr:FabD/lysophospholipase-like protein [Piedraia hortae CBS 480.64]